MKQNVHVKFHSEALLEELEARQLFSGGIEGILADTNEPEAAVYMDVNTEPAPLENSDSIAITAVDDIHQELVFIDTDVENYQELLNDILNQGDEARNIEVILLDNESDGIEQISAALANYQNLDAVHLISHGSDGSVDIGNTQLDAETLNQNLLEISGWGDAFSEEGDFLIYGCNLAATEDGQGLVDSLSSLTHTDVAASDDLTGQAELGGDWKLEYKVGTIESDIAISDSMQKSYANVLAVALDQTTSVETANSSVTLSHTTSGENRLMLVGISMHTDNGVVTSIDYNGTALNLVGVQENAGGKARIEIWSLVAPDLGTHDLNVTFSGSRAAIVGVQTFTGVDQSIPIGTFFSAEGSSTYAELTGIVSAADEVVFGVVGHHKGTGLTSDAGQTESWDWVGDNENGGGTLEAGDTSVDLGWTLSSSDRWAVGAVSIKASNDAPVISSSNDLTTINEDEVSNSGTLVSALISGQVTDADVGSLLGIVVTNTDNTNGTWEYTTNGGGTWTAFASPSTASARLLAADANTSVRFVPNSNWNGTVSNGITFHAWDQSTGSAGGTVNLTGTNTIRDTFSTNNYDGNDGTVNWTGSWTETSDDGASSSGNVYIDNNKLHLDNQDGGGYEGISRDFSLNGASTATLSFDYDGYAAGGADSFAIKISNDGGTSWTLLENITAPADTNFSGNSSYTLENHVSLTANMVVSFDISGGFGGGGQHVNFDNIQIGYTATPTGGTTAYSVSTADSSITINPVNDRAVISGVGATLAYTEGDSASVIDASMSISDIDGTNIESATISISSGLVSSEDVLNFTTNNGITGSYTASTGTLALIGTATLAQYEAVLESVTYQNTNSINPDTGNRTVTWVVNDGNTNSTDATSTITVTAINSTPVEASIEATPISYTENDAATVITSAITISDIDDSNIESAVIQITSNYANGEDVLVFTNTVNITGSWDAATGIYTLTGSDTLANYEAALRSITYQNISDNPSTANRTISFTVNDGNDDSNALTRDITITAVNDASVLSVNTSNLDYGSGAIAVDPLLNLSDVDNTHLQSAIVKFSNGYIPAEDTLTFTNQNGITGVFANGVLTLTGNATVADYQTALRSVQYEDINDPVTKGLLKVKFSVFDGTETSNIATRIIKLIDGSNPRASDDSGTVDEGGTVVIDLAVNDTDDVGIDLNSIVIVSGASNGTVTVNGNGTVTYIHNGLETISDSFLYTITDGTLISNTATVNITVTPVNDISVLDSIEGTALAYTENDGAIEITSAVNISDVDDTNIESAVIQITANYVNGEDILTFVNTGNIIGSWDVDTGTLTVTGSDTLANYNAALRSVTYQNTSEDPSTVTRTVSYTVNDGDIDSNTQTRNIIVTSVNDAPVNTIPGVQSVNEDTVLNLSGISVNDVDSNLSTVQLSVSNGSLNVILSGVTSISAGINGSNTLTLTGSQTDINTTLASLTYKGDTNFNGAETLTVLTTDSNAVTDIDTVAITVNAVNDAAIISNANVALTETDSALTSSGTLTSIDVDNPDNTFTAQTIVGTIGTLNIDAAGAWDFIANSAFDNLNAGQNVNETFSVSSVDGSPSSVKLTINGTNDLATVSSADIAIDETDAALTSSGTLISSDVDNPDNTFTAQTIVGTIGTLNIDAAGAWDFTANSAFDSLNAGQNVNETFSVSSVDGSPSSVKLTINGTNDLATVSSADIAIDETDAALTSSGTLISSDVDNPDNTFTAQTIVGTIGTLNIDAAGAWDFTANSAFDNLNAGQNVNETFSVSSVDGSPSSVKLTINGTNDLATVSSADIAIDETDAALTSSGTLISSDVDNPDNTFTAQTIVGTIGTLNIDAAGAWDFTANSAFDNLNVGDNVNETYNITSVDGTASTVVITINGTDDAATVSSANIGLTETDAALTSSGTLTSTDVDNLDNTFTAQTIVGTIGTLNIDAAGAWDFTANSAFDSLNVGDNVNETFNITSVDGTASTVVITINGTDDAATVSSANIGLTETDAALTSSGTLISSDVDNPDNTFTAQTIVGTIGTFNIDAAGAWDFTANSAFDSLNVGDNVNETYNITSVDGTASIVVITINGTDDAATVSSANIGLTETDAALTSSGTLTSVDVDNPDNTFTAQTIVGTIGTLNIDAAGAWDFTANSAFDSLNVGDNVNETYNITSVDGTTSTVVVTINGTDDAATVSSANIGLTETDAALTSSGTLTSTDVDNLDNTFTAQTIVGTIGTFNIDAAGAWDFTANSAFDSLNVGDNVNETYNITSVDGTASTVVITINGTDDAATVSSANIGLTETDAALTSSGTLTSSDVDNPDNTFTAQTIVGTIGTLNIDAAGAWDFTANSAFDSLNVGDNVNETYNISSVDGTASTVVITINGTNDAATVSSANIALTETDAALTSSGTLTSADVDNPDNTFTAQTIVGTIGTLNIDAAGAWDYTANSAFDSLNVGDNVNETYNITSVDGTTSTVQIQINGTNDAATVSSANIGLTETDTALTSSGTLTSVDVDNPDNTFTAQTIVGTIGTLNIDAAGAWDFTANSAFDSLNVGDNVNETYNITSVDGTASTVVITINGTDDAATVSSANIGLTETDAALTSSGTLTSTDVDNLDNTFTAQTIVGTIGTFNIDAAGAWDFTANSAFDSLNVGDNINETYNITSVDGTASTVQITINGTNDVATVSSANIGLTETDNALTSSGTLTSTDVDNPDNTFTAQTIVGTIGTFNIDAAGAWDFTANSAFDSLNVGDNVNETYNITSVDGTASTVQIQINGTDDAATVSSANIGLTETDSALTSSGTLTSVDVDNPDNTFTAQTIVGTIGTLNIDAAGAWDFTANSAFDSLNVGDNVNETYNITSVDGTTSTVVVTINGTDDAATVSSANIGLTETDAALTSSGTLTSTDVDNLDNTFTAQTIVGTIGTFNIDAAGAWDFTANSAFDSLNVGDNVNETYNITSVDGTASTVVITINGTDDAATVSSANIGLTETDAALTSSGTLTSSDVDNPDNTFTAQTIVGTIGTLNIDAAGAWDFTANSAFDSLNVGDNVNETYNISSVDGTASTVVITINGTNDAATVSSANIALTETDAALTSSGTLTSADVDNPDNTFTAQTIVGTIGTLNIDAAGAWDYTANSAFDSLNVGDNVNETYNITSVDGTTSTVQIQINGTNDAATVSSANIGLTETDTALTSSGTLTSVDVDNPDNTFTAQTIVGTIGTLNIDAAGAWDFTANSAFDSLNVGDNVNETYNITSVDGTASTVVITINGTDDAATVSSANIGLTETDAALTSSGTLTSTDVDNLDNTFTAQTIVGTIGTFNIDAAGAWDFTANSAFDSLNVGDNVNETYNITSVDGTASTVVITINGTDDAATVSSANIGLTETDAALTSSGTLTSTDVDNLDNTFTAQTIVGTIGTFNIDAAGAWDFTANSAFDSLNVGDNVNETYNITSVDGTASTVVITINGTDDAATVSSANIGLTETDAALTSSGTLTSSDVDNPDNTFTAQTIVGTIGTFNIDAAGAWDFTANSAFDSLNVGDNVNETFNITSVDGTASTVVITINGTDDAATVSSANIGLTETDAALTSSGTLTSSDVDNPDNTFTAQTIVGTIGTLNIDAAGAWDFTANSAFDSLNVGDNVNETYNITSVDGTASIVVITINGTDDAATVSSANIGLTETDAALTSSGTLTSSDVDNPDNTFTAQTIVGTIGTLNIDAAGAWDFTANSAFDSLNVGDNVNETYNITSVDGTASTVQIQINGTNDAATVSSANIGLTETGAVLTSSGTLTSTDVDNPDDTFTAQTIVGTIGTFNIDAAGAWDFTANSAYDSLNVGDNVNETFNITSVDGTASTVQIQINGTNDAATVSSANIGLTETDAALTSSGTLTSSDVDNPDDTFTAQTIVGTIGTLNIDAAGAWDFTANSAFDSLNVGDNVNETYNITSVDGTASTVQIQINGTNDAATVSSANIGLTETDAALTSSGTLTSSDVDNPDDTFTAQTIVGTIGTFNIDAAGAWDFTANSAFDSLNVGDNVNETYNITSVDGTASIVVITINGTDDVATVSTANIGLTETDAALTSSGTLTSTDVDNPDNTFTVQTIIGTIGTLNIDAAGAWDFTANSAFDSLNVGDNVNETFNITSVDGTASTVVITINGTDDAATVSSANIGLTETDAALTSSGTLTSSDVDNPDNTFTAQTIVGTIGTLNIDAAGAWDFTANSAFDSLNVGDNVNETYNITSVDGTTSTVVVTINGTDDAATVSSANIGLTETDAALTSSGTLTSSDVDNPDNTFTAQTIVGTIGTFNIDAAGAWDFTANSAFDSLNVGDNVNETYNITSVDGTASTVVITINGTNDAATVSSANIALTETDAALSTSGTLTSSDVDNIDNSFNVSSTTGTYGDFSIATNGDWTFTANAAFDELNVGDQYTEIFNVTSIDNTTSTVQITINGTNDAATVSSANVALTETDAALSTSGTLTSSDVDNIDNSFNVSSTTGTYGDFSIASNGDWTFTANAAFDELNVGDQYTETFNVTSVDNTTSTVQITINGTNDAATVSSASVALTETDAALSTSGTLTSSDVDNPDNTFNVSNTNGTYGDFAIDAAGAWTFTANAAFDELNVGDQYTETFNVTSVDNTSSTVQITINGTNDNATVSSANVALTETDAALSTSGTLTSGDVDNPDNTFNISSTTGTYGDFAIDAAGAWTFTANAAFDELNVGDQYTETFNVTSDDNTTSTVQITINGTNDDATVSSANVALTETDAALSTSGTLTSGDVDNTDNLFNISSATGTYGDFSIATNGDWTFTANAAFDELNVGDQYTETFNVTSVDNTTSTVQITINGTNDNATVSSANVALTETDAALSTSGTLTSSDVDNPDNTFNISSTTGTYGDFAIDAAGAWTFTANAAFDELNVGDQYTETFNVTSVDNTTSTVQITINGTNDNATVSSANVALTETDAALSTSGTLTSSDVDNPDNTFNISSTTGTYGDFAIDAAGAWTFTANAAFDELNVGDQYTETFNVTSVDNTSSTVQITINGTNDAATVSSANVALTETNTALTTSGTLTSSDVDNTDNTFNVSSTTGTYGDFSIASNGDWTFTANAAFDELNVGDQYTETFNVTSVDNTTSTVQITINGTNDVATVSSANIALTETDAALTTSGTLTSIDVDNTDNLFIANSTIALIGTFSIDAAGAWTFTGNSAFDNLNVGQSVNKTFSVSSVDGTVSSVTITINGTNDMATVSSADIVMAESNVVLTTSGTLTSTDVDNTDNTFNVSSTTGTYGDFAIDAAGTWAFTANAAFDELNVGDSYTETFNVISVDNTSSSVTITINGTNDTPVISGVNSGSVQEDVAVVTNYITTSGQLTIVDADTGDSGFQAATVAGSYGDLTIDAIGYWSYRADNTQATIQQLGPGESITDILTVISIDGTSHNVIITLNGSDDTAVIGGTVTGSVQEDGMLTTSGILTITDTDSSDPTNFANVTPQASDNGYGTFEISANTWTYNLDNSNTTVQALDGSETLIDTYTFTAPDGVTQQVTVTINGSEDIPVVTATQTFSVSETALNGLSLGNVLATDIDTSSTLQDWTITSGNEGGIFAINSATGEITVIDSSRINFETTTSYRLGLTVSDGSNISTVEDVMINVTNAKTVITSGQTFIVSETAVNNSIVGSVTTTGDSPLSYSITAGNTGAAFAIDNTGNITVADISALDYETLTGYTLAIQVSDGTTIDSQNISISVINVEDNVVESLVEDTRINTINPTGDLNADDNLTEIASITTNTDTTEVFEITDEYVVESQATVTPPSILSDADAEKKSGPDDTYIDNINNVTSSDSSFVKPASDFNQWVELQFHNLYEFDLQLDEEHSLYELSEINGNDELWKNIDLMRDQMDADKDSLDKQNVEIEFVTGATVSITAGVVSWVMRGGAILSSLLSSVSLFKQFDPMAVVFTNTKNNDKEHEDEQSAVEAMFDNDNKK